MPSISVSLCLSMPLVENTSCATCRATAAAPGKDGKVRDVRYRLVSCKRCDGGWRAYIRDEGEGGAVRKRIAAPDEGTALAAAREVVARLNGSVTVGEALDAFMVSAVGRLPKGTVANYRCRARKLEVLRGSYVDALDRDAVMGFAAGLGSRGYSAATVANVLMVADMAVRLAVSSGKAGHNPFAGTDATPGAGKPEAAARAPLDSDERTRLERTIERCHGRVAVAAGLALGCGMRPCDIARLRREDACDGRAVRVALRRGVEARDVPSWLAPPLRELLSEGEPFVVGTRGRTVAPETLATDANGFLELFGFGRCFGTLRLCWQAAS